MIGWKNANDHLQEMIFIAIYRCLLCFAINHPVTQWFWYPRQKGTQPKIDRQHILLLTHDQMKNKTVSFYSMSTLFKTWLATTAESRMQKRQKLKQEHSAAWFANCCDADAKNQTVSRQKKKDAPKVCCSTLIIHPKIRHQNHIRNLLILI